MNRYIGAVLAWLCLYIAGCANKADFSLQEYLEPRRVLIDTKSDKANQPEKSAEFTACLFNWVDKGLAQAYWQRVYSDFNVERLCLSVETGNSFWPYYRCQSIVKTTKGFIMVAGELKNVEDTTKISLRKIDNRDWE